MLRNKKTEIFSLALSILLLVLVFIPFDPNTVGLQHGSGVEERLAYSFFHANLLHCLLNVWCFLSCMFLADVSFRKLLLAYLIACSAPALSAVPTIGLSGVCFALLGMVMWQSADKRAYNIIIGITLCVTTVLCPKAVNNVLHVYCYLLGVASVPLYGWLLRKTHNQNM